MNSKQEAQEKAGPPEAAGRPRRAGEAGGDSPAAGSPSAWDPQLKLEVLREVEPPRGKQDEAEVQPAGEGEATASRPEAAGPEGAAPAGEAAPPETEEPARERDRLREELLRLQADFINFRKRMERDRAEQARRSNQELIADLLVVLDHFDLALINSRQADGGRFREGVELIRRQLGDVLARHGLEIFGSLGERFDPHLHEAVAVVSDPQVENQTVVEELQPGYRLHGRLLRPARVRVVVHAGEGASGGEAVGEGGSGPAGGEGTGEGE